MRKPGQLADKGKGVLAGQSEFTLINSKPLRARLQMRVEEEEEDGRGAEGHGDIAEGTGT